MFRRPPMFVLKKTFGDAYRAGRFLQNELITQQQLMTEARKLKIPYVDQKRLEALDKAGAFCPIAFVRGAWHGSGEHYKTNAKSMTFRDEAGYRAWSHYGFRLGGYTHATALYSRWQLIYLEAAMNESSFRVPLEALLGSPAQRDRFAKSKLLRQLWRGQLAGWKDLDRRMKPLILFLCWIQNRYLPFVTAQSILTHDANGALVDPLVTEFDRFKPRGALRSLGLTVKGAEAIYDWLLGTAWMDDPQQDWFDVFRAVPPSERGDFEGTPRFVHLLYDGAELCRRFLADATGKVPRDVNEHFSSPGHWKEKLLEHERRVGYDLADFKRILESKRLTPFGLHVFVEGPSDETLIAGIVDDLLGHSHRDRGIRFTKLRGIGQIQRNEQLIEAFSTYVRHALLVADDEGKIDRDVKHLKQLGLLKDTGPNRGTVKKWKKNIEEDSFSDAELIAAAKAAAKNKYGVALKMTVADLNRYRKVSKKSATSLIVANAAKVPLKKVDIAHELRKKVQGEIRRSRNIDALAAKRDIVNLALGIARAGVA